MGKGLSWETDPGVPAQTPLSLTCFVTSMKLQSQYVPHINLQKQSHEVLKDVSYIHGFYIWTHILHPIIAIPKWKNLLGEAIIIANETGNILFHCSRKHGHLFLVSWQK